MASVKDQTQRIVDGQLDYAGGIDSSKNTTIQIQDQPYGIPRNMLAWLNNGTCRGGGISTRPGWDWIADIDPGLFQGAAMYEPDVGLPYILLSVAGHILAVRTDLNNELIDLSEAFGGLFNSTGTAKAFFCQAERWMVIQSGDGVTLPLIWDGATLRRSIGITSPVIGAGTPGVNEIPAATAMVSYQGRLWYATNFTVNAGDIVRGASGTLANGFRDAVLNVTENPASVGGDGFTIPSRAGTIRALAYTANLDTALGQGPLYVCTSQQIHQLVVPVKRADWIAATTSNPPQMTIAQVKWGVVSDRSVVHVNGDLYYRTLEPGIRSLVVAVKYFNQWGNTPVSGNMQRVTEKEDRALLSFSSGIQFDNRLLETVLPVQTAYGVAFQGIAALDFEVVNGLQDKLQGTALPAWDGMWEPGLTLQLLEADFGGLQRAFAVMLSARSGKLQIWEPTNSRRFDYADRRVQSVIEFPAYNWGTPFDLKELDGCEFWLDKMYGLVDIRVEWREDANPCWHFWTFKRFCTQANTEARDVYPQPVLCNAGAVPVVLEKPQADLCNNQNNRPVTIGCQHQVRLIIKGACQVRGLRLFALPRPRAPYGGLECGFISVQAGLTPTPTPRPAACSILLTVSATDISEGQSVTLTATVTDGFVLGGMVVFKEDDATLGTSVLLSESTSLTIFPDVVGSHVYRAFYSACESNLVGVNVSAPLPGPIEVTESEQPILTDTGQEIIVIV